MWESTAKLVRKLCAIFNFSIIVYLFSDCKIEQNSTKSETKNYMTCLSVKEELISTRTAEISWAIPAFIAFIVLFFVVMVYAHCSSRPRNRPQQIELIYEADMPINPDSRSTLIM